MGERTGELTRKQVPIPHDTVAEIYVGLLPAEAFWVVHYRVRVFRNALREEEGWYWRLDDAYRADPDRGQGVDIIAKCEEVAKAAESLCT